MSAAADRVRYRRCRIWLALALATPAPWAAAQSSPYYREFGYIPLSDGVRIAYVAYRPTQDGKYPTIMQYDPYVAAGAGPNPGWLDRDTRTSA